MGDAEKNLLYLLAHTYLRYERPREAAILLAALDAVAPGHPKVLRALALAQDCSGQSRQALDTLDRVALTGKDAAFHLLRARALAACERRLEAAAAMASCVALQRPATHMKAPA